MVGAASRTGRSRGAESGRPRTGGAAGRAPAPPTPQNPNLGLGRYGEEVAARRLAYDGLRILERNWRCSDGEIDIVALDGETLAVCEVKTRSERAFQHPAEGIDRTKADRLRRLAERWLSERWPVHFARLASRVTGLLPDTEGADRPTPPPPGGVRIDLIAVVNRCKGAALVEHVRGAV
ncbi:YraN family protein [Kitasatospora sp. NPDC059571]|uniref:YraN family protein n=1 Tax=Kitasatospora sp. NPDC059571 TaxID=3346871 RepID=UPI0036A563C5